MNDGRVARVGKSIKKYWLQGQKRTNEFLATHLKDRSLRSAERFIFGWMMVFFLVGVLLFQQFSELDDYYLTDGPAPGGHYIEGMVGTIDGVNPLFADGAIAEAAGKLIFSSLLKSGPEGELMLDAARSYDISEDETVYTVNLRDDVYWHDSEKLNAEDVAFTVDLIQNPDVESHLQVQWRDIDVSVVDEYVIEFELPNPFAPFVQQLDFGIVPQHLLRDVDVERLRVASFNQQPVGSGPFAFEQITSDMQLRLRAHQKHHRGVPKLERFSFIAYEDEQLMLDAYNRGELRGMTFSSDFDVDFLNNPSQSDVARVDVGGQVFAFLNNEVIDERAVRQALTRAINTRSIRRSIGEDFRSADSPLLPGHLGYTSSQLDFNPGAAREQLEETNLSYGDDGWLYDGDEPLRLRLITQDSFDYPQVALRLKEQWEEIGIGVDIVAVSGTELQEEYLRPRNFDVLLFGVGLGSDPDVHAYWHSSQALDPGRNVSQYSSEVADINLDDGRTRTDEELRAAKYEAFQAQWRRDAPAVALYRLHAYYVYRQELEGAQFSRISHPVNRFYNITDWTISTEPVFERLQ